MQTKEEAQCICSVSDTLRRFVTAGVDSSPNSWDVPQTARVLQLHRNTVDNRIKRTEQLFGVDLKNARTRRKLSLALDAGL